MSHLSNNHPFVRPKLTRSDFYQALDSLRRHIDKVYEKHQKKLEGNAAQLSWHENYGDVSEEVLEYLMAIQKNDPANSFLELHDVATAAIWGISSFFAGYIDPKAEIPTNKNIPGTNVSWIWKQEDNSWEGRFPVEFSGFKGEWIIYLIARPSYCDRGRWNVIVDAVGVPSPDDQEGFPRYFFKLDTAKSEMEEWVKIRSEIMKNAKEYQKS